MTECALAAGEWRRREAVAQGRGRAFTAQVRWRTAGARPARVVRGRWSRVTSPPPASVPGTSDSETRAHSAGRPRNRRCGARLFVHVSQSRAYSVLSCLLQAAAPCSSSGPTARQGVRARHTAAGASWRAVCVTRRYLGSDVDRNEGGTPDIVGAVRFSLCVRVRVRALSHCTSHARAFYV